MTPKVSMVMSTYSRNHGDKHCPNLLRRALDSILGQTFKDFELVLIDDGSTDGSEHVCREYEKRDSRVRLCRFEQNSGLPAKRYNDAFFLARADYFMFMFDDDMLFPNAIQDLYSAITTTHKNCGMIYGFADIVNSQTGGITNKFGGEWSLAKIRENNFLCNFTVIIKREVLNTVGGVEENPLFRRLCDWDMWVRIGEKFTVARIDKTIGIWNFNQPDSIGVKVPMTDKEKARMRAIQRTNRVVRLQGKMGKKFRFCFAYAYSTPTLNRWNLDYPCAALKQEGIDAEVVNVSTKVGMDACEKADAVLLYRTVDSGVLDFFRKLKTRGKFLLYAVDDYIFQPGCKYATLPNNLISSFFSTADAIVAPNSKLLEKITENKTKILRRNVIDQETFNLLNPGQFTSSAPSCYAIGWLAGLNRQSVDPFIKEVLKCLDQKLGDGERVGFICFGQHGLGTFEKIKVVEHPYIAPDKWQELYREYCSFAFSAVINPLDESDEFFHCKSELKFVETGAMMVPLITSRVHPFTEVIREGENGFFASTPEEFADKALMVCRDSLLAEKVATAAHKQVKEEYNSVRNARCFMADVMEVMANTDEEIFVINDEKPVAALGNLEQFQREVVGPVADGSYIEMVIPLMPACVISSISVLGATYCRKVRTGANFQVWLNRTTMREGEMSPAIMIDNAWWKASFPPFPVGGGSTLIFRLFNCDSDVGLGFYICADQTIGRAKIPSKPVRSIAMKFEIRAP